MVVVQLVFTAKVAYPEGTIETEGYFYHPRQLRMAKKIMLMIGSFEVFHKF